MLLTDTPGSAAAAAAAASMDDSRRCLDDDSDQVSVGVGDVTSPSNNNAERRLLSANDTPPSSHDDVSDDVIHCWPPVTTDNNNQLTTAAVHHSDDDDDGHVTASFSDQDVGDDFINSWPASASPPLTTSSPCHNLETYHASLDRPLPCRSNFAQHWGTKGDMVYSLLSILGTHNRDDMSRTLLAMSTSSDSCLAMRQSGCLPLLVHLIHDMDDPGDEYTTDNERATRARASAALHNVVLAAAACSGGDDATTRYEARVLRLLEQLRSYCDQLRRSASDIPLFVPGPMEVHPGPAIAALMKLSFDEQHRHAICNLGGLQAIAELLQRDNDITGNTDHTYNVSMRRYACMSLTNLTFADGANKALLCSMQPALRALVAQLDTSCEDLCQVAASVLRNLSWHSDLASKRALRDVEAAGALMRSAMVESRRESTLKSVLSALWNLSSHSPDNKADICCVPGALEFLVNALSYRSPSRTLSVIETAGGILRNVSSHVAVRDDYRAVLRQAGCLQTLLRHLRSPSLTVVSNACGTLWNLSARCAEDQSTLLQLGAVSMLKNLVHSRHRMISMGSAAALKNLLTAAANMPSASCERSLLFDTPLSRSDSAVGSSSLPVGLHVRRQRAFEEDLNRRQLSETCDDLDSPGTSPTNTLRSPAEVRSSSARYVADSLVHRRIQSPSPLRLPDRSVAAVSRPPLPPRSSSYAGISTSMSSDQISAMNRGCYLPVADRGRRPADWSAREPLSRYTTCDPVGQFPVHWVSGTTQMMTSFTATSDAQSLVTSPSSQPSPPSLATGARARRFLKSASRKPNADSSTAMSQSFLSERSENVQLADLEFKSSFDFDSCGQSVSPSDCRSGCVNGDREGETSSDSHSSDDVHELLHRRTGHVLRQTDENTHVAVAASEPNAKEAKRSQGNGDEASNNGVLVSTNSELTNRIDQLMPQTERASSTKLCCVTSQHRIIAAEPSETDCTSTSAESINLLHATNRVPINSDKMLGMQSSANSDVISDIMDESFPNMTLSTNTDLCSSTDLLTNDQLPCSEPAADIRLDPVNKHELYHSIQVDDEILFDVVAPECSSTGEVLCYNSTQLVSLLEENAQRVLRELELNTAASTSSSSDVRLLDDETISLLSGLNDNEFDVDDDYNDAVSSRTYDISSASGDPACSNSRRSSCRSSSSESNSHRTSPPAAPIKTVAPGRPRIVKPDASTADERRQDERSSPGEVKSIRGRRKALYSVTKPKQPAVTAASCRSSSSVRPRPVVGDVPAAKRPSSANTACNKPTVVRPVISKPSSGSNKVAQNARKRVTVPAPASTPRVQGPGQTVAVKKAQTSTQLTVVDSKVKRPADGLRSRSVSAGSFKSQSRPAANKNERPTLPVKQATFVKTELASEDSSSVTDEVPTQSGTEPFHRSSSSSAVKRSSVTSTSSDQSRPFSASSVRSNKPQVSAKPAPPVRAGGNLSSAQSRVTAASKVAQRHSSPNSVRRETTNPNTRTSTSSAAVTAKSSPSSSASATSLSRLARTANAASAGVSSRKPVPCQPQTAAKPRAESSCSDSAAPASALTRTSTYDKLDDTDKLDMRSVSDSSEQKSPDSTSELRASPPADSSSPGPADDPSQTADAVIRRASRHLVEQADQIQTRRVSPPQSIRFSGYGDDTQPRGEDVVQRPAERQLPEVHGTQATTSPTDSASQAPQPAERADRQSTSDTGQRPSTTSAGATSPSADRPKPSASRKFGFIGLWRRQTRDHAVTTTNSDTLKKSTDVKSADVKSTDETNSSTEVPSPRRRTFSWWRKSPSRTTPPSSKTTTTTSTGGGRLDSTSTANSSNQKSLTAFGGRDTSSSSAAGRPRSPTCRAAVVTPFSYRPSPPPMFADLPESHQTKTAMLIERRMRRLKMASESSAEQTSECLKMKPEVAAARKNFLVTTV